MSANQPLTESRFIRLGIKVLLLFLIILVGTQITFIFRPLVVLFTTLFLPILTAGALYYLSNPIIQLLMSWRVPRVLAVLLLYVLIIIALSVLIFLVGPNVARQIETLVENTPVLVKEVRSFLDGAQQHPWLQAVLPQVADVDLDIGERAGELLSELYRAINRNMNAFVGFIANITVILTTVPFILFFMLKDGYRLPETIVRFLPSEYRPEGLEIIHRMSSTLAAFIQGQMIVSVFVGTVIFIGYTVIGLEYALLLAVVALVTNLIPYVGPIIGTVPGMVVGLLNSPFTMLQVVILVIIVQQIESQLISPLVMGKKLKLHPLTVIFVLLTAGSLAGFFGLLLAVPTYAVGKTAVVNMYQLYMLKMRAGRKILRP